MGRVPDRVEAGVKNVIQGIAGSGPFPFRQGLIDGVGEPELPAAREHK